MTALGEVGTRTDMIPNLGTKMIQVVLPSTASHGDTFTVDLTKYGASNIHGILGFVESTTGSIVVLEQPTTAVSAAGLLTATITGSAGAKVRTYYIFAY
jgi:hypothetical protein